MAGRKSILLLRWMQWKHWINGCTVWVQFLIFTVCNDLLISKWGLANRSAETVHSDSCGFYQPTLPFTEISRRSAGTVWRGIQGNPLLGFLCWCKSYISSLIRIHCHWIFISCFSLSPSFLKYSLCYSLACFPPTLATFVSSLFPQVGSTCLTVSHLQGTKERGFTPSSTTCIISKLGFNQP